MPISASLARSRPYRVASRCRTSTGVCPGKELSESDPSTLPAPDDIGAITRLLRAASEGRDGSHEALFGALHGELRRRAGALMTRQPSEHTLQATALVNEVYLRLFREGGAHWEDRRHFLLSASQAMRHLLVDHARQRSAAKRAGRRVPLEESQVLDEFESRSIDLEALDAALLKLGELKPEMARAVELRFFANVPQEETARILDMPLRTLQREWALVRAWLYAELS